SVISAWYKAEGGAVTLVDTIVFSSRYGASRRFLWAHELTHVMQYRELGIEDFARVYVTNPQLLERQAWDNARRIVIAIQRNARRAAEARSSGGSARLFRAFCGRLLGGGCCPIFNTIPIKSGPRQEHERHRRGHCDEDVDQDLVNRRP